MKKLTALLDALVLALSLVPEAALADDGAAVFIDGKQFLTDGVSFYVYESGEIVSELPSGCGSFAAYENSSGILILNNYTGGGIMAYGVELKISVDGSNTIGTPNAPVTTGIMTDGEDVILVGSGSLTVYFSENGIVTSEDRKMISSETRRSDAHSCFSRMTTMTRKVPRPRIISGRTILP